MLSWFCNIERKHFFYGFTRNELTYFFVGIFVVVVFVAAVADASLDLLDN